MREPKKRSAAARTTRLQVGADELMVLSYPAPRVAVDGLTPAEREVLAALLAGKSRRAIAAERGRSAATVDHQVDAIFRKLGVRSRSELAARCSRLAVR
jgi:DNA-binding NarL/FixJ family response regulator